MPSLCSIRKSTLGWNATESVFEFFGALFQSRIMIDNAKCAITKACYYDPVVQRAYGEYAEGYGFKIDPYPPNDPAEKGVGFILSPVLTLKR